MTLYWGAWATGSTNRGMRLGIDVTFSAVTNTSASCTATMKFYTQNVNTWDEQDKQMLEFDGNYSLPETHEFYNQGDEAGAEYRTSRTYTWTYSSSSYNVVPTVLDIRADLLNMYNGAKPYIELHINFPVRPFGAPTAPDTCAVARSNDEQNSVSWQNNPTTGKPYTATWLERYIYLGPGMVSGTGIGGWTRIATLAATATSFMDTGAIPNRKYTYRVQADNSVATSGYAQSGIIFTAPATPGAPLRTEGTAGSQALTWTNNVGYTEYQTEVWRAVAGTYSLLATVASGVTTYTDTTASAAQKTKYKFRAKTTSGTVLYSAYSVETTETSGTPTAPAKPTNLKPATGTIDPTAATTFTWTHVPTDGSLQTYYEVQYRHVGDVTWQTSGKKASATASWVMPANSVAKGNQIEWQVRTWGYSSTLAGAWSASAKWMTTPLIPLKYPMFLDVDTGQVEATSKIQLISEQTRRVATVSRITSGVSGAVAYNILTYTLPVSLARTGKKFRIQGQTNLIPNTDGMYTDLSIRIGVAATTGGTAIAASYVDHRISGRNVGAGIVGEYTFDPATAGGENIATINIVLVGTPVGGNSYNSAGATRPTFLIIDEIIEGQSTASAGGGPAVGSATTIVAGPGLTGGGDLTANRTIDFVAGDNTLLVAPDSVKVNPAVMATRAYVDSSGAGGGPGGGANGNEVIVDFLEPVPVAGHPEIWVDTGDNSGELGSLVSGAWGTTPLDAAHFGTDSLQGAPIYLDTAGKLRAAQHVTTVAQKARAQADLLGTYPLGQSITQISAAQATAGGWAPGGIAGMSGTVVTVRRAGEADENAAGSQWYYVTTSTLARFYYRSCSGTGAANAWSPWVYFGDPIELAASIDLNTIITNGKWSQSHTADAASGTNYPVPHAGLLEVTVNTASNSNMVWQRYTVYDGGPTIPCSGATFTRGCYSGIWQPWVMVGGFYSDLARASAAYTTTTAAADVAGMTLTVPVSAPSNVFRVDINLDVQTLLANAAIFIAALNVGGTGRTTQGIWAPGSTASVGARTMVTASYRETGLTPGNVVFKVTAHATSVAASMRVNQNHSTLAVTQVA